FELLAPYFTAAGSELLARREWTMPAGMYFHSSISSLPPAWRHKRQCRDTQPIRGAPDERRASSYLDRHRAALTDRCQRVHGCVEERQVGLAEPSTVVQRCGAGVRLAAGRC